MNALFSTFGLFMPYVFVIICIGLLVDIVVGAFSRGRL